jgi:hypothetical protein
METKRTARVLVRRENASDGAPWYVAQVLEFDLATQAKSLDGLAYEIQRMIVAHIVCSEQEGMEPFALPPAPRQYHDEYVASKCNWTVDVARFKTDAPLKASPPELSFRFAPGM